MEHLISIMKLTEKWKFKWAPSSLKSLQLRTFIKQVFSFAGSKVSKTSIEDFELVSSYVTYMTIQHMNILQKMQIHHV